jgi:hypothetical protein
MQAAFAADRVDTSIAGDWEDVQVELGLKTKRNQPRKRSQQEEEGFAQVSEMMEHLEALRTLGAAEPPSPDKPMPYRKPAPEPEPPPSGKRRRHHKRK